MTEPNLSYPQLKRAETTSSIGAGVLGGRAGACRESPAHDRRGKPDGTSVGFA